MKKLLWILLVLPMLANAAYNRNEARPVNEVVYGEIDTVRYITQQEIVESKANGWETLLGAAIGGLIGNQFGGGTGKEVATAVGAVAGAGIARNRGNTQYKVEYKLVELLVKTKDNKLVNIIQDVDNSMLFNRGDDVRILY
ncbi:glycine zipper 2TM domain-containing protein, partial [Vibrio sp. 10N.261.45.A7]